MYNTVDGSEGQVLQSTFVGFSFYYCSLSTYTETKINNKSKKKETEVTAMRKGKGTRSVRSETIIDNREVLLGS
jgi:hypothetical protein